MAGHRRDEERDEKLRFRTESNRDFPQVVGALYFPEEGRELEVAVRTKWDVL